MKTRFLLIALVAVVGGLTDAQAARSCTADERTQANAALAQIASNTTLRNQLRTRHLRFGAATPTVPIANERILVQGGYVMKHDDDLRTTLWVEYRLTAQNMIDAEGNERVNCFRTDPRIPLAKTGSPADYVEPRFDQGHMVNDADMKYDLIEQVNSYVMSNMSPQECRFNRGIWLSLERLTRTWATDFDTIFVHSGAIFDRDGNSVRDSDSAAVRMASNNGNARVAVPNQYYRVILREDAGGEFKSIAFMLDHTNAAHGATSNAIRPDVLAAVTTLETIEAKAGLQLFPNLDRDELEQFAPAASGTTGAAWDMSGNLSNLEGDCP
jgi:endonuclease G